MLTRDQAKRLTAGQSLQHKWFKQTYKPDFDIDSIKKLNNNAFNNLKNFNQKAKLQQTVWLWMANGLARKEETSELNEIFRRIDTNCDGKIDKQEMIAG